LHAADESHITEIELLPDGRLCLFGATTEILRFLEELGLGDPGLRQRLMHAAPEPVGAIPSPEDPSG
jgi:hypothetical protein